MRKILTYALNDIAAVAAPTDFLQIQGGDGILCQILRITISIKGVTVAGSMSANLVRRSAAFTTQGTAVLTAISAGAQDNQSSAASTVNYIQTANITTVGPQVGGLLGSKVLSGVVSNSSNIEWEYRWGPEDGPRLRGSQDFICVNFNGNAIPTGGVFNVEVLVEEGGIK